MAAATAAAPSALRSTIATRRAARREPLGDRPADAARAAGHQRHRALHAHPVLTLAWRDVRPGRAPRMRAGTQRTRVRPRPMRRPATGGPAPRMRGRANRRSRRSPARSPECSARQSAPKRRVSVVPGSSRWGSGWTTSSGRIASTREVSNRPACPGNRPISAAPAATSSSHAIAHQEPGGEVHVGQRPARGRAPRAGSARGCRHGR